MSAMVTAKLTMNEAKSLVGYVNDGQCVEGAQEAVDAIEDAIVDAKADEARERIRTRVEDAKADG